MASTTSMQPLMSEGANKTHSNGKEILVESDFNSMFSNLPNLGPVKQTAFTCKILHRAKMMPLICSSTSRLVLQTYHAWNLMLELFRHMMQITPYFQQLSEIKLFQVLTWLRG
jgi:hypothetical protein